MRLIDADALIKEFLRFADDEWNQKTGATWARGFEESAEVVEAAPTIDPVKHGKWIVDYGACEPDYMECSYCNWITEYYGGLEEEWNYCPRCGARMKGEEDDSDKD